jgi:hypothetical protein
MAELLAQLIPVALAAALSTVPITVTIFVLLSERRSAIALPFSSGWVIGTAAGLTLATLAAQALPSRPRHVGSPTATFQILIGSALVVLGLAAVVRRTRASSGGRPGWIEGVGSFGPLPALGIGLALNLRPKSLLLFAAASLPISGAGVSTKQTLTLIAAYTAVATSTVVAPTLATVLFPTRMEPRLVRARDWINAHGSTVTGVVMILIGLFVIGVAITR